MVAVELGTFRDTVNGRRRTAMRTTQAGSAVDNEGYWSKTRGLMITCMVIWFVFGFGIHFFVDALNQIVILGFPLGFYMAAQGSLIVFVILIFWFASKQNKIDAEYGVDEQD
jgi:putative solute:sodium symporter small subunit